MKQLQDEPNLFEITEYKPGVCPYCGSKEVYWYLIDLEESRNGIRCDDCKATWWSYMEGYGQQFELMERADT